MSAKHSIKVAAILLLLGATASSLAQAPQFTVIKGKTDADGFPVSGATVCLQATSSCFQMPDLTDNTVTYQFGLDPHMKVVQNLFSPWLLFDATFSGGGSGTLTRYAVLRVNGNSFTNLLPKLTLTNVSDFAVWNEKRLSKYPLLITADFIWNFAAKETHFSPHYFTVDVWRYSPTANIYQKVLTYKTSKRYNTFDSGDVITVIAPERSQILRRLSTLTPNH